MKNRILTIFMALGLAPPLWSAGTCVISNVNSTQIASQSNRLADPKTIIVTLTCTADASAATYPSTTVPLTGAYPSGTILNTYNLTGFFLYQVGRTPGGTAPTGNYTVTVTDTRNFALDMGLLTSNGSASAAQLTSIANNTTSYPIVRSALTVAISGNAVNSAQITIDLVFRATSAISSSTLPGGGPVIRGTGITAPGVVSAMTVNFPIGTTAGDFAVVFIGNAFQFTGTPSGWTLGGDTGGGSGWNTSVISKVLNSSDIGTGNVSFNLGGSFNAVAAIVTFVGGTAGVRSSDAIQSATALAGQTSSASALTSDMALIFVTNRTTSGGSTDRSTVGNLLQSVIDGGGIANGYLYGATINSPSGKITPLYNLTAFGSAAGASITIVKGV